MGLGMFLLGFDLYGGEGNGNPLQGSCLGTPRTEENSIAPWVIAHRVTKGLYMTERLNNRDLIIYNF